MVGVRQASNEVRKSNCKRGSVLGESQGPCLAGTLLGSSALGKSTWGRAEPLGKGGSLPKTAHHPPLGKSWWAPCPPVGRGLLSAANLSIPEKSLVQVQRQVGVLARNERQPWAPRAGAVGWGWEVTNSHLDWWQRWPDNKSIFNSGWSSWLAISTWFRPSCCSYLQNEPGNGKHLSFCCFFKQILTKGGVGF